LNLLEDKIIRFWLNLEAKMKALRDPEGAELSHLIKSCELIGKDVLEIGCGDGKFIRQYATMPKWLVGIDPDLTDLSTAKNNTRSASPNSPHFIQAVGEKLPFPSHSFDIVIFASSL
jgi:ubiquinone/menaquinone biosynthesis C-methylase UbiE